MSSQLQSLPNNEVIVNRALSLLEELDETEKLKVLDYLEAVLTTKKDTQSGK